MANYFGPYDVEEQAAAPNALWTARRELADALRRLNSLAVTSMADAEVYTRMAGQINAQADTLARSEQQRGKLEQMDPDLDYAQQRSTVSHEISPLTGLSNPIAPPMNIWFEDDKVKASVTMGWQFEGPPGCIHGGYIAALFDDFLGVGQKLTGKIGFTGTIQIRYIKPTPLDQEIKLVGWLERQDGRKNTLRGEMYAGNTLTASAEGLFIQMPVLSYRDSSAEDAAHHAAEHVAEHVAKSVAGQTESIGGRKELSRSDALKAADKGKRRP
jgi:acyl-coenzyme A thioesterase PaaI-like protein